MEFPANSHKDKETKKPKAPVTSEKNVEKVVEGEVVQRKKPLGRRFKDIFLGADFHGATTYIFADVLIPAVRNMIVDASTKGIERFVYGETTTRPRGGAGGRTQYNSPVNRGGRGTMLPDQPPRYNSRTQPARPNRDDIVLVSREEAELVLDGLRTIIEQYDVASVADYHDLVGLPTTFVDNKWGWTNLSYVETHQVREGWLINLPSPEQI